MKWNKKKRNKFQLNFHVFNVVTLNKNTEKKAQQTHVENFVFHFVCFCSRKKKLYRSQITGGFEIVTFFVRVCFSIYLLNSGSFPEKNT